MKKINMSTFMYSFILLWTCGVGYGLGHTRTHPVIDGSQIVFNILTGITVLSFLLGSLVKSIERKARESGEDDERITKITEAEKNAYRNNKHLPFWLDIIFYLAKIGILTATLNLGLAIIWLVLLKFDVQARLEAGKRED